MSRKGGKLPFAAIFWNISYAEIQADYAELKSGDRDAVAACLKIPPERAVSDARKGLAMGLFREPRDDLRRLPSDILESLNQFCAIPGIKVVIGGIGAIG